MSLRLPERCVTCVAGAVFALTMAACGGSSATSAPRLVTITERDFVIHAPHSLPAGEVRFSVQNDGPVSHELILVRAPAGRLPMRADGITVDEEALEPRIVGSLEPAGLGTRELQVHLAPGHYLLLCNMAGHYMSGMSTSLRVT